ncbi:hypothetical protein [Actinopolymorpha alba]|uniref:hypothetical protein n=1 Tax=Actinopolymorpha alba TaxID=533267 RepID=UPI0003A66758|nr:hypothetical protein [Actinopolymorpha alba]
MLMLCARQIGKSELIAALGKRLDDMPVGGAKDHPGDRGLAHPELARQRRL